MKEVWIRQSLNTISYFKQKKKFQTFSSSFEILVLKVLSSFKIFIISTINKRGLIWIYKCLCYFKTWMV